MSNFELEGMMKNVQGWKGTVTRDLLPAEIDDLALGIINYDSMDGNGTHWVAYANYPKEEHVIFFDSFGVIPGAEIQHFLKTSGKEIAYSTGQIQDMKSIMCGYYCVYVLKELSKGRAFEDILSEFDSTPSAKNEKLIKNKFKYCQLRILY